MASCERALTIDPNSIAALITRGNVLAKLARYEEALASFDRAAAIDPCDVDALNNRGFALTQLRRFAEALATFDRALAIDPRNIGALDNRGAALFAMNRFEEALAIFDRALALKPDRPRRSITAVMRSPIWADTTRRPSHGSGCWQSTQATCTRSERSLSTGSCCAIGATPKSSRPSSNARSTTNGQ
jgi:tetratricopeptide (TPR) repeat protein